MKRVLLQPAYVLHRRSYRETSLLVELFTPEHGRLSVLARGVRKARSAAPGLLQPFIPLLVSWSGNGELKTLTEVEANGSLHELRGECLFAGFYLNELLTCLLQKWDPHLSIYLAYQKAVLALQSAVLNQKTLRLFEKLLLEDLGYGILPKDDPTLMKEIAADQYYQFIPEQGFIISELGDQLQSKSNIFLGKSLLAYARCEWNDTSTLQDAKRLTRLVLAPLLGTRPLFSRRLFMQTDDHATSSLRGIYEE